VAATAENAVSGDYPLARFLYIYVNKRPGTPLPPLEREFIKLVLSRVGQDVVDKDGYVPLNARMAARELRKID
jgi:phosphate transport system substrate-binding protein